MIAGAEIALLLYGIWGLFTEKLTLSRGRVLYGAQARLGALIACAPLPLSVVAHLVFLFNRPDGWTDGAVKWCLIGLEAICLLLCVLFLYLFAAMVADDPQARYENSRPEAARFEYGAGLPRRGDVDVRVQRRSVLPKVLGLLVGTAFLLAGVGVWLWMTMPGLDEIRTRVAERFFLSWHETAETDIDAPPPTPAAAGPVPALLRPASFEPRIERMATWNNRTLAAAYEKVGHKDPKWDEHALSALEMTALQFSNGRAANAQPRDIRAATQKAIEAGCDDPLIFYVHARFADPKTLAAVHDHAYAKAAKAMESSAYPAMRRAQALWKAAERQLKKSDQPAARAEAERLIGSMLQLMPVSAREEERCLDIEEFWYDRAHDAIRGYKKLGHDAFAAWQQVDTALTGEKALEPTRLVVKGEFYIKWAWEARGSGWAHTVTPEGLRAFDERLDIAREALERSSHGRVARLMLTVELGHPRGRASMEAWFERALDYQPEFDVCWQKLEWLNPKWHGTLEDMIEFGRACRDSQNWERNYPMVLALAHRRYADRLLTESDKAAYFRRSDVAQDILYVYAKSLERSPNDRSLRSRYAFYSYLCGHPRRAHRQFELLGDNLWWGDIYTEEMMKTARAKAANQVAQQVVQQAP